MIFYIELEDHLSTLSALKEKLLSKMLLIIAIILKALMKKFLELKSV
jgi:hypothetical protein